MDQMHKSKKKKVLKSTKLLHDYKQKVSSWKCKSITKISDKKQNG